MLIVFLYVAVLSFRVFAAPQGQITAQVSTNTSLSVVPKITCPDPRLLNRIKSAIEDTRQNLILALIIVGYGTNDPKFDAFFKSNRYIPRITDFLSETATFAETRPATELVCIRSKDGADRINPQLWTRCENGSPIFYSTMHHFPLPNVHENTVFLCPRFFELPSEGQTPRTELCPKLVDNQLDTSAVSRFSAL